MQWFIFVVFLICKLFWIMAKRTTPKCKMPLNIKQFPKQSLDRELGFETQPIWSEEYKIKLFISSHYCMHIRSKTFPCTRGACWRVCNTYVGAYSALRYVSEIFSTYYFWMRELIKVNTPFPLILSVLCAEQNLAT